jgi:hypothetical protein
MSDISDGEIATVEAIDKFKEVLFYEDITHLFGFCDLFE